MQSDSEEDTMEKFEEITFKIASVEVEKERDRRKIYKLSQGRDKLKGILERTSKREEESKLKGREAQRQKSAELARWYECELGRHYDDIDRLEDRVKGFDGKLLELKELRDDEKMRYNSAAELQKK